MYTEKMTLLPQQNVLLLRQNIRIIVGQFQLSQQYEHNNNCCHRDECNFHQKHSVFWGYIKKMFCRSTEVVFLEELLDFRKSQEFKP